MTLQTVSRPTDSPSEDATRQPVRYVPAGTGQIYWGPADKIRFLITGEETGGAFFLAEVMVSPGGGTRPHVHRREEETFRVLEGILTVRVGGQTVIASPGDVVYLPRGVAHCFQNTGTTDAKFLLLVTPAGLEEFFEEGFLPASGDSETRPDFEGAMMARLFAAAQRHGIELSAALPGEGTRPTNQILELDLAGGVESAAFVPAAIPRTSRFCQNTGVHHVGIYASDPRASAEFYRDVLGMEIVGGSGPDHPVGASAFLSSRPKEESHEIALFSNPAFAHVAFKVSSLAEFERLHRNIVARGIPIKMAADHHASLAFYFDDADGNMIEVYWPTGDLSRRQPQMEPLDLTQLEEHLRRRNYDRAG